MVDEFELALKQLNTQPKDEFEIALEELSLSELKPQARGEAEQLNRLREIPEMINRTGGLPIGGEPMVGGPDILAQEEGQTKTFMEDTEGKPIEVRRAQAIDIGGRVIEEPISPDGMSLDFRGNLIKEKTKELQSSSGLPYSEYIQKSNTLRSELSKLQKYQQSHEANQFGFLSKLITEKPVSVELETGLGEERVTGAEGKITSVPIQTRASAATKQIGDQREFIDNIIVNDKFLDYAKTKGIDAPGLMSRMAGQYLNVGQAPDQLEQLKKNPEVRKLAEEWAMTSPEFMDVTKDIFKRAWDGYAGAIGSGTVGPIGLLLKGAGLEQTGQSFIDAADYADQQRLQGQDPRKVGALAQFGRDVSSGLGFTGAAIVTGALGNTARASLGLNSERAINLFQKANTLTFSGLNSAWQGYSEAKSDGATDEQAKQAALFTALTQAPLELVSPLQKWVSRFDPAQQSRLYKGLHKAATAVIEGTEEALFNEMPQQIAGNLVKKFVYDPNQDIFEGVQYAGGVGGASGILSSIFTQMIAGKKAKKQAQQGDQEGSEQTDIESKADEMAAGLDTDPAQELAQQMMSVSTEIDNLKEEIDNDEMGLQAFETGTPERQQADMAINAKKANLTQLEDQFAKLSAAPAEAKTGITPEFEAEYLRLAQDPIANKEKLQAMVDEAAKATGLIELFHGSSANEDIKVFENRQTSSGAMAMGIYMSPDIEYAQRYGKTGRYFVDINLPGFNEYNQGLTLEQISKGETLPTEGKSDNGAWRVEAGNPEVVVSKAEQIKSSDAVVYDNAGNIIPLSKRFQGTSTNKTAAAATATPTDTKETSIAKIEELNKEFDVLDENDQVGIDRVNEAIAVEQNKLAELTAIEQGVEPQGTTPTSEMGLPPSGRRSEFGTFFPDRPVLQAFVKATDKSLGAIQATGKRAQKLKNAIRTGIANNAGFLAGTNTEVISSEEYGKLTGGKQVAADTGTYRATFLNGKKYLVVPDVNQLAGISIEGEQRAVSRDAALDQESRAAEKKLEEEVIHLSMFQGIQDEYKGIKKPKFSEQEYIVKRISDIAKEVKRTNPNALPGVSNAYLNDKTKLLDDMTFSQEFMRMVIQRVRTGQITEDLNAIRKAEQEAFSDQDKGIITAWKNSILNALQFVRNSIARYLGKGTSTKEVKRMENAINNILDEYGIVKGEANYEFKDYSAAEPKGELKAEPTEEVAAVTPTKEVRNIEEASQETGVPQEAILTAAQNGEIEAAKVGNDWRFGQKGIDEIKSKLSETITPAIEAKAGVSPATEIEQAKIYSPIKTSEKDTGAYHFGDGGIASDTTMRRMGAGRGTGHYGTGTYFLGKKEAAGERAGRPMLNIDLAGLNMATPGVSAIRLHDTLRLFNKSILQGEKIQFNQPADSGSKVKNAISISLIGQISGDRENKIQNAMLNVEDIFKSNSEDKLRTPSTYLMQELGFDGIDVRGTDADNTTYGSVVFAKPVPSPIIARAGVTPEGEPISKRGQTVMQKITTRMIADLEVQAEMLKPKKNKAYTEYKSRTTKKGKTYNQALISPFSLAANLFTSNSFTEANNALNKIVRGNPDADFFDIAQVLASPDAELAQRSYNLKPQERFVLMDMIYSLLPAFRKEVDDSDMKATSRDSFRLEALNVEAKLAQNIALAAQSGGQIVGYARVLRKLVGAGMAILTYKRGIIDSMGSLAKATNTSFNDVANAIRGDRRKSMDKVFNTASVFKKAVSMIKMAQRNPEKVRQAIRAEVSKKQNQSTRAILLDFASGLFDTKEDKYANMVLDQTVQNILSIGMNKKEFSIDNVTKFMYQSFATAAKQLGVEQAGVEKPKRGKRSGKYMEMVKAVIGNDNAYKSFLNDLANRMAEKYQSRDAFNADFAELFTALRSNEWADGLREQAIKDTAEFLDYKFTDLFTYLGSQRNVNQEAVKQRMRSELQGTGASNELIEKFIQDTDKYLNEETSRILQDKLGFRIDEKTGKVIPKPLLSSKIKEEAEEQFKAIKNLKDISKLSTSDEGNFIEALIGRIITEVGMDKEQATELATLISTQMEKAMLAQRSENVDRAIKDAQEILNSNGVKPKTNQRTVLQKLIEMANMGVLDAEGVYEAFRKTHDFPKGFLPYDADFTNTLREWGDRISKLPPGVIRSIEEEKMGRALMEKSKFTTGDILSSYWYFSLLSQVATQGINALSGASNLMANVAVWSLYNPKSFFPMMRAMYHAIDGRKSPAVNSFLYVMRNGLNPSGMQDEKRAKYPKTNVLESATPENTPKIVYYLTNFGDGKINFLPDWMNTALKNVNPRQLMRVLRATDMFLREVAYEAKAAQIGAADFSREGFDMAKRQAESELFSSDATGKQKEQEIIIRANEIYREQRLDETGRAIAEQASLETAFNQQPVGLFGLLANFVNSLLGKYPATKFVIPFTNVVANVTNEFINYTPFFSQIRLIGSKRRGVNDPFTQGSAEKQMEMQIKGFIGFAAMFVPFIIQALTGGDEEDQEERPYIQFYAEGPKDPRQKKIWQQRGGQKYSVRVGNTYFSYLPTPLVIPLAMGAMLQEEIKSMNKKGEKVQSEDIGKLAASVLTAPFSVGFVAVLNQSFLTGLADLLEFKESQNPVEKGTQVVGGILSRMAVPGVFRDINKLYTEDKAIGGDYLSNFLKDFPGSVNFLNKDVNYFGDDAKFPSAVKEEGFGRRLASVVGRIVSTEQPDPAFEVMYRNNLTPPSWDASLSWDNGKRMTKEQELQFIREAGPLMRERIVEVSDELDELPIDEAQDLLSTEIRIIRREVKEDLQDRLEIPLDIE